MFQDYTASDRDLNAICEALKFAQNSKMQFVFNDLKRIGDTLAISYDSKYIYIFTFNSLKPNKVAHNLIIPDEYQYAWWAYPIVEEIIELIPDAKGKQIINGGLLTPFTELQKRKKIKGNPYVTRESYLATIIHEFGHVYWNSFKLWWPSDKEENIGLLENSKGLYEDKVKIKDFNLKYPNPIYASEVFAQCTEYYASEVFWPIHKKIFDKYAISQINKMIESEKNKNLNLEDSVLEPTKNQHNYSLVISKILISSHPKNWPEILISPDQ